MNLASHTNLAMEQTGYAKDGLASYSTWNCGLFACQKGIQKDRHEGLTRPVNKPCTASMDVHLAGLVTVPIPHQVLNKWKSHHNFGYMYNEYHGSGENLTFRCITSVIRSSNLDVCLNNAYQELSKLTTDSRSKENGINTSVYLLWTSPPPTTVLGNH